MPSQRPYFLSSFLAAFRPQGPSISTSSHQPNKHTRDATTTTTAAAAAAAASSATTSTSAAASSSHHHHHHHHHQTTSSSVALRSPASGPTTAATSPGNGAAIPIPGSSGRRGSDSSSEGFRDVIGADKFYIGGRTPGGEEKFFKLGVIRRVRSNDGLSLDRLSL
ncbi:uncharacterized protein NECHADRAFT_76167 [Fusarium vanettenii 77-13-4]|uniref:Uncharacterized protein n=1 Tax=Fusarium vanettenii (strain ATCC MYA-4622 / CBS 123669 / FGSC 9596 / NRRL 45880 / 77-13-4) TaxID=660122 RepID=C7Z6P2_FUSV7|nr:uncharacterized protein NECHADRAFT_76167 [Fusarium vanettenii 77-13-4]EEU40167.1 hypothetical protein NECHADRAFT_76167 [Fusarium vanettenii 77-13-4]